MDVLLTLTAGLLVRYFHIGGLDQLSENGRVDFFDAYILISLADELFDIFVQSFLCFNFLSQSDYLCFKLFLLRFIALTEHIEALVIQLAFGVVLVNLDEQPFQFRDTAFIVFLLLVADLKPFCRFQLKTAFHHGDEMLTVVQDIVHYQLNVSQDQTLQH